MIPAAATVFLVSCVTHGKVTDYVAVGGDAATYWHEIATFVMAGLHGGYYGFEELTAKAASLGIGTFGSHSMWFTMLYGSLGKVFGWHSYSGICFNMGFMTLGLLLMVWLMRADWRYYLKAGSFLAAFPYLYLYSGMMMQEAFHYAMAFFMAGLFYRVLSGMPVRRYGGLSSLLFLSIFVSALMRYSWGVLFLPYFLFVDSPGTVKQCGASVAKAFVSAAAAAMLYVVFAAPYPYEPFPGSLFGAQLYSRALSGEWHLLAAHVLLNIRALLQPEHVTEFHVLFYVQIVFVFVCIPIILRGYPLNSA